MAKTSPQQEFLETLQDPTMAQMKAKAIEIIRNPSNYILEINTTSYHPDETIVTIKLQLRE